MQTDAQRLIVVRDQFALKNLSDDALKQILPAYKEALDRIQFLLKNLPSEGASIERELWLRTQLATIRAQFEPVADRIYRILPEAQVRAFEQGLRNAQAYLEADPSLAEGVKQTAMTGATVGGQTVTATGNLPGFNVTGAVEKGFISPSITRQQIVAATREGMFSLIGPGGSQRGLNELLPSWLQEQARQIERHLRNGFLLGMSTDSIVREIGPLAAGRRGWAMTEVLVRDAMSEASQAAHDAFYEANEDLLIPTKSGFNWWWDASNDSRLCSICAPLDGIKFKDRDSPPHPWKAHWGCRCKILPWTRSMEIDEEESGRSASGSFLESVPVERNKKTGKRLPAPEGFTGEKAYKRPMRINGKQHWVRRVDMGPGETTAGDMLKHANPNTKHMVLGTWERVKQWDRLIQQPKYARDPQSLVRDLLAPSLRA